MNDFDRHDLTILVQAVEDAQAILAQALEPGGISDRTAVLRIVAVLDYERRSRGAGAADRMSLQADKASLRPAPET